MIHPLIVLLLGLMPARELAVASYWHVLAGVGVLCVGQLLVRLLARWGRWRPLQWLLRAYLLYASGCALYFLSRLLLGIWLAPQPLAEPPYAGVAGTTMLSITMSLHLLWLLCATIAVSAVRWMIRSATQALARRRAG